MKRGKRTLRNKKAGGVFWAAGLFYLTMLALTLIGKAVYRNSQTPVTVGSPDVSYRLEDGNAVRKMTLPAEMSKGAVYTIARIEVNGSLRMVAKEIDGVVFGEADGEGRVTVEEGIGETDILILGGAEKLYDGKEVKIINEEDLPAWWK